MGENLCPPFITNKVKQYCSRALPFFVSEFCNFLTFKSNLIYAIHLNLVITKIVYAFNRIYKLFWVEIASYCLIYYPRAVDLPLFVFSVGRLKHILMLIVDLIRKAVFHFIQNVKKNQHYKASEEILDESFC